MDDTNQPIATVSSKPTTRYERADKVTLKNGELRIVLRKDNTLKENPVTGVYTTISNDRWYDFTEELYASVQLKLQNQGFVELEQ